MGGKEQSQSLQKIKEGLTGPRLRLVERLRELYEHSGWDGLGEFSAALNYSKSQISRILSGERLPAQDSFSLLFSALADKTGRPVTEETISSTLKLYFECIRESRPHEYRAFMLEEEKKVTLREIESAQRTVDAIKEELSVVYVERNDLDQKRRALEASVSDIGVQHAQLQKRIEAERVKFENDRTALTEQIRELTEELRDATAERDEARQRCQELTDELNASRRDDKHETELSAERSQREELEKQLSQVRNRLNSILEAQRWLGVEDTETGVPTRADPSDSQEYKHDPPSVPATSANTDSQPKQPEPAKPPTEVSDGDGEYTGPLDAPISTPYRAASSKWSAGYHTGIDFDVPTGTSVRAIAQGEVESSGWAGTFGYQVIVKHPDNHYSQYAHLSALSVRTGEKVKGGQRVGRAGSTGTSTRSHLHLEIRTTPAYGSDIDPVAYLSTHGISIVNAATRGQQPTELLVTAQIRRLRSHDASERANAVTELRNLLRELPHTSEEGVDALCAYVRRAAPAAGKHGQEPGILHAVEAILDRRTVGGPPPDLHGANLSRLPLQSANLAEAKLRGANFALAYLRDADLHNTDLQAADMTATDLTNANLCGADLSDAVGLTSASINRARFDLRTVFPSYLKHYILGGKWLAVDVEEAEYHPPFNEDYKLPYFRVRAEVSIETLSQRTGLSKKTIERLESPGADKLSGEVERYLVGLGLTLNDLFAPTKPDNPRKTEDTRKPPEKPYVPGMDENGRVDLGGLLVPGVGNTEIRVEVAGDAIIAATIVLQDSAIQLQAFAAPKNESIWGEVREEIATGITQQGGVINEVEGPLGWELRAQVPVQLPDGTGGFQAVRFVGLDGPRWFLRGVISGQGAVQPQAAGCLEQIFRDTIVVRGDKAMAPRDPITLILPEESNPPEASAS